MRINNSCATNRIVDSRIIICIKRAVRAEVKSMLTAFCVALLILGVISISIISEININFDVYEDRNFVSFSLFYIKIAKISAKLKVTARGLYVELLKKDKNIACVPFSDIIKSPERLMPQDTRNPFCNLDLVELDINGEYGDGNAFSTALVAATMQKAIAFRLLNAIIKQKVRTNGQIVPNFQENAMNLHFSGIFFITLADIIYGIVFNKKQKRRKNYDI